MKEKRNQAETISNISTLNSELSSINYHKKLEPREKSKLYNFYLTLVISTGGAYFGFYISCFNPLGDPILTKIYHKLGKEKSHLIGNINSLFALGALLSVIFSGYISNKIGRMRMLLIAEFLSFATYGLYRVENLYVLQATRFLSGVIAAINTAVSQVALKEMLPRRWASAGGMIIYITCVTFVMVVFSLGLLFDDDDLAKNSPVLLLLPAPLSVLRTLALMFLCFETPKFYFLVNKKNEQRAVNKGLKVLKKIFKEEDCLFTIKEIKKGVEEEEKNKVTPKSLFTEDYRQQFLAAVIANIGQQLSGINFLIFYSTDLFTSISGKSTATKYTFVMGVIKVLTGFFGTWAINKFGRRPLLLYGVLVQGFSFLVLNLLLHAGIKDFILIPIAVYLIGYALGVGATTLIYTADVLPPVGVGIALGVQWVFTGLVGKMVPILDHM